MNPKTCIDPMKTFSLLLVIFLPVAAETSPAFNQTPRYDDCALRKCGNLWIRYPFWLGGQQPSYCGFPPFNLSCSGGTGTPVLAIHGFQFNVSDFFYGNKSVQLMPSHAGDDLCPFIFANITSDLFPFTLRSSNRELVFFYNCSSAMDPLLYQSMTCQGGAVYFGGEFAGEGRLSPAEKTCKLLLAPVRGIYPEISRKADYAALLQAGWMLNWNDPYCTKCWKSDGRCGYDQSEGKFMCFCRDQIQQRTCGGITEHHMGFKKIIIIVVVGLVVLVLCPCVLLLVYRKISDEKEEEKIEALLNMEGSLFPKRYKYREIKEITNYFSEKLGQGGFGIVYKGTLRDGHPVAVKILRDSIGNVEEFINEIASISRTSHVNIVNLLGFCLNGSKRALVCEFMLNGSLDKFIYTEKSEALGFEKLYEIALGIARGLEYLHCRCNTRIVHFDIKPQNILLDKDFCPKISDFGFAKLCTLKESTLSMVIPRGTAGYIAPEVYSTNFGSVSSKSDVYSYGTMVLEMLGARRDYNIMKESSCELYFPHWIHDCLNSAGNDIVGLACLSNENKEIVRKMIMVSLWCIQMIPTNRPSMSRVVDMLEGSTNDLQMPPKP